MKNLLLIDGHALLYRAFFSYPLSLTLEDGTPTNAVYGFTRLMLGAINELKPTHLAVSFDVGKTFRHESYAEYKAHREKMPEELKQQEPLIMEVLAALNVPIYTNEGFEADDVIGTLARQAETDKEAKVLILTGDRDMWQLVDDQVLVYAPGMGKRASMIMDDKKVKEVLGVWPKQIPDYKGLAGDSSDNIVGVPGIGPKTAVKLISEFGSIEGLYEAIGRGQTSLAENLLKKLVDHETEARESMKLTTIVTEVGINLNWDHCEIRSYDRDKAVEVLLKYRFKSLVPMLPEDKFEQTLQEALF